MTIVELNLDNCRRVLYLYTIQVKYKAMKIKQSVLDQIKGNSRLRLALALNCSEQWIIKLMEKNQPNGPLTLIAALNAISEETGLTQDEILEADSKVIA